MTMTKAFPAAESTDLPEGVVVQPRRYEFEGLEDIPQYWFAHNPITTHVENAFSILIPPGERFFIRSVRHYADQVTDPDTQELIRAFCQQEALHTKAHNELNASFKRFGIDVDREIAYADRSMAVIARILSPKSQLAVTAFLEHLTATGAHMMFQEADFMEEKMHPEMLRFWRWHAAEELEHKAVAFDLYHRIGGGYVRRVLCAVATAVLLAVPFVRIARRMMHEDPHNVTAAEREEARAIDRKLTRAQLKPILGFFKRDFHPWNAHDEAYLREWYAADETAAQRS